MERYSKRFGQPKDAPLITISRSCRRRRGGSRRTLTPAFASRERATRNAAAGGEADAVERRRAQVIRDKKEAEQVAKKLFKDRPGPPKKVKDARKAVKKEESIKLTRGGGAPPIPKPPSGEPPSEEEARRRARRLMRRMSRKRKGKKHRKSKAFKKGML